jgi:hypothetical protein
MASTANECAASECAHLGAHTAAQRRHIPGLVQAHFAQHGHMPCGGVGLQQQACLRMDEGRASFALLTVRAAACAVSHARMPLAQHGKMREVRGA